MDDKYILNLVKNMKYKNQGETVINITDNICLVIYHSLKYKTIQSRVEKLSVHYDIVEPLLILMDPNIKNQLQLKLEEYLIGVL
ncbi:MAG: hypothetical protein H7836_08135 [Magnetococcus sp. YQC-3]